MNFNSILNQILTAGQEITRQNGTNNTSGLGSQQFPSQNSLGGQDGSSPFNFDMLKGFGGGAAATGLLSLLLGNKGFGNSALKLGSVAAIGSMAYSAWKNYQAAQQQNQASGLGGFDPNALQSAPASTFEMPAQDERTSQIIIKAMIAAAAADGRIDTNESNAILAEMKDAGAEEQAWLQQQLSAPPTAQDIAADVGDDTALASQVYLASRIVCGDLDRHEIIYLHDLATAMHLDNALVEQLEKQAGF